MQHQTISARRLSPTCIFCKSTISAGAAVWRAGHPHHAGCLVRTLTHSDRTRRGATLGRGLLPAGKARNDRRTDLYKTQSATAKVGRDA